MDFKIILFTLLTFSFQFVFSHQVEIAPHFNLSLKKSEWDYAKGSFFQGGQRVNLYSNKKIKDFQILFEDTYLLTNTVVSRLPQACQKQLRTQKITEETSCFVRTEPKANAPYSFTSFTVFKTKQPNVVKVRSVHFVGQKKDLQNYENKITRNLASTTAVKNSKENLKARK